MRYLQSIVLALAAALAIQPSTAWSSDAVGRIISVQGQPKIERATGGVIDLRREDPVHVGDIVRTGSGRAKILFVDNSIMTLAEQTDLKITEFLFQPQTEQRSSMFDLLGGKVKTLVGKWFSAVPNFQVRTPTAVAGVRGTHFQVDFDGSTLVTVFDGEVDVANEAGEILKLLSGNQLGIGGTGFIGGVNQLTPEQLNQKQNEVSLRLEALLNSEAEKKLDRNGFARRAVDGIGGLPGSDAGTGNQFLGLDGNTPDAPDPLSDLQSVDPARTGNVNLIIQTPAER